MLKGHCDKGGEDVTHLQNIILSYFTEIELNSIDNIKNWQILLDPLVRDKLRCRCGELCENVIIQSIKLSNICLIEFDRKINDFLNFDEQMFIRGQMYILKGLVRHQVSHFMCAVSNNGVWNYIDDLKDEILICLHTCACLFLYRFASLDLGSFKSSN